MMEVVLATAKVIWVENEQFVGIDSSNHSVVLSTQNADNAVGVKPSDMLLVALASCTAVDVVQILKKKRMPLTSMSIQVKAEQDEDPPWTFKSIHMHFMVTGKNLTEEDVQKAIDLSEGKYCSVSATLKGAVEITTSLEILRHQG
jgi:putative redox protein